MHNFCNLTVPSACKRVFLAVLCKKGTQKSHRLCISASTMASCWSGRRGSNSLPPPWQGGAHQMSYGRIWRTVANFRGPRKDLRSRLSWCLRNRTNDTGFSVPALPTELQRHNRCICPCTLPNPLGIGAPAKICEAEVCGEEEEFQRLLRRSCVQDCQANR